MTTTLTRRTHGDGSTSRGARLRLVEVAGLTDTGRVREHNEDRLLMTGDALVVADGMGGHAAGEVAATIAVDHVGRTGRGAGAEDIVGAVGDANTAIRERGAARPGERGMGTTLTVALVRDEALDVVHVGDSRGYLVRDGRIARLTDDHTLVAELHRRGALTDDEAESHPHRNVVTRALGAADSVTPDHVRLPLRAGDVVVVCSDGLSDGVPDEDIARAVAGSATLAEAAEALVARANAAGGSDNITVVLGRVDR
jgi:PPM family protein phosphatase